MKNLFFIFFAFLVLCSCNKKTIKQSTSVADTAKSYIIYIGTYTEKETHVEGKAGGIYVYRFNPETGELTFVSTSPSTVNPSFLTVSEDGKYLFAVNETGNESPDTNGGVSSFRLTDNGTHLQFINQVSSEGDYPCYVETDKNGKYIYTANYGTGNIAVIPVGENGVLKNAGYIHQHEGRGNTSRQESPHAHSIRISDDGRFLYSNDLGTDEIYIYKRGSGADLEPIGIYKAGPGAGPRHLAFHPTRNVVYSINELNGTIECMNRDTATGMLSRFQTIPTIAEGNALETGCADIHITPSGEFLYATNRGSFNTLAAFRVNEETGSLQFISTQSVMGRTPRNFAIDPTGTFILVANQNTDQVVTFRIDKVTGRLSATGAVTSVPTPVCIKFRPAPAE